MSMTFKAWCRILVATGLGLMLLTGVSQAKTVQLIGFGDSLMAGYELPADAAFPAQLEKALKLKGYDVAITNAGVSGDTSADGLARLDWSIPDGTDGVILELGANDALRGLSPDETLKNLDGILTALAKRNIPVLMAGILAPPNMGEDYARRFNAIFTTLAEKHNVVLYPFFLDGVVMDESLKLKDGMHPNEKGVAVMVSRFMPVAEAFLANLAAP
jgi:acyl-CoA thioesterase-1